MTTLLKMMRERKIYPLTYPPQTLTPNHTIGVVQNSQMIMWIYLFVLGKEQWMVYLMVRRAKE